MRKVKFKHVKSKINYRKVIIKIKKEVNKNNNNKLIAGFKYISINQ